jgi:general secretion pathway protein A
VFLKFYGLKQQPFGVTPDPRFLYLSPAHREALASLFYGIDSGCGFLALIAKPGMGKTTLLFHLLQRFRTYARTAFLFQTQCTSREFMRLLLMELGCESKEEQDLVSMYDQFNRCLLQESLAGRRVIVVIDEAQNLEPSVLETVRLLSDFETPQTKLLQIVLAGQPELADKLARKSLSQLRQRISLFSALVSLPFQDVERYMEHRLRMAGYRGGSMFSPRARQMIAELSEGIPRSINTFCFNALSLGCALQKGMIDVDVVREVASDLDLTSLGSQSNTLDSQPHLIAASSFRNPSNISELKGSENGPVGINSLSSRQGREELPTPADAQAYLRQIIERMKTHQRFVN